ncbi:hypothetical protein niasHT_007953 [Heterodera trifolii]|uniref:Uncharacterized protein n=1 Tax=Heterodera trifolii TaxID=157864 RepID=A0ABD2LZI5_9BILA
MARSFVGFAFDAFKRRLGAHDFPFLRGFIHGFNYYDVQRVKQIGAERAAAEWVVRCEGKVKFDHSPHIFSDYNALQRFTSELDPKRESDRVHLVAVDATDSCISGWGCRHFDGLSRLQNVRFVRCKSLTDNGLQMLADSSVSDTLLTLHIEKCPKVTNSGIRHLRKLKVLNSLTLQNLKNVWKPEKILDEIRPNLPSDCANDCSRRPPLSSPLRRGLLLSLALFHLSPLGHSFRNIPPKNAFCQMGVPSVAFLFTFLLSMILSLVLGHEASGDAKSRRTFSGTFVPISPESAEGKECPAGCTCAELSLECAGFDLETVPNGWPSHFERIVLRNWTMSTIDKNAFRRFQQLRELHILDCPRLDLIERHAFKQLRKLRLLVIRGNKSLRELHKASFSAIGNEQSLSIQIADNAIERIRSFAFKNAQNLRELSIEERCFELESCALGAISRLDFVTLHGLNIAASSLNKLPRNGFAELSYISQLQIRECRIGRIDEGALGGLFTVGSVQLQSNQIVRLSPGWSSGMDNVGKLVFTYNTVREPMVSPECLRHDGAQRFEFADNTLHCSCALQWMINAPEEEQWLAENYCGAEENFKALLYFSPAGVGCAPWIPPAFVPPAAPFPSSSSSTRPSLPSSPQDELAQSAEVDEWSDPEDEPFPNPSPHRRHSSHPLFSACPPRHHPARLFSLCLSVFLPLSSSFPVSLPSFFLL